MKSRICITIIGILSVVSCQKKHPINTSINGVWQSVGSGWILHIQDSTSYSFYDTTTISCLPAREAELEEIIKSLTLKTDTLSLLKGVMTYKFTKINALPHLCTQILSKEKKNNPMYNFEIFSETVKHHYAFMELNAINWQELYNQQKQKLHKNPSQVQLFKVIEETLELLNDNHAYLEATQEVYDLLEQTKGKPNEIEAKKDLPEYGDFQIANMVAKHHLTEDMTEDSWLINWGEIEDGIGFIQLKAMWLYADLHLSRLLIEEIGYVDAYVKTFHEMNEGIYIKKEVEGVRKVMDKVMRDLMETKSIVIDLRFNGGGQDAVNFEILKRFNDQKKRVVTTKLKDGNGFSQVLPIYLEATSNAYTKPVYVLTSRQTGSASEAFAIGSMSIPHLKRIGTPTQGALSTALEKTLPNGWSFSISNEVYMDCNGKSYENIGVPVNYRLNYPEDRQTFFRSVAKDLNADKENILRAIAHLQKQQNFL